MNRNYLLNNKKFINFWIFLSMLSLHINYFLSLSYEIKEFKRPILHLYLPITCLCIILIFIFLKSFNFNDIRNPFMIGILCGLSLSLTLSAFNYTFKTPVKISYKLIDVSQGKNTIIYTIQSDNGEKIPLTIATSNWHLLDSTDEIFLYKGALGYYFGTIHSLKSDEFYRPD